MIKLQINPIVIVDLKNIKEYIAEESEEMEVKLFRRYILKLRIYNNFHTEELI